MTTKSKNIFINNKSNVLLLLIFIFFGVTEAILFHIHSFPLTRGETDGIEYMAMASGPIFQANPFHGPGYSLLIRLSSYLIYRDIFRSAKIASIFFGFSFILVCYSLFTLSFDNKRNIYLCLVLLVVNPIFLSQSNLILSDIPAAFFYISSLTILVSNKNFIGWKYAIAGACGGMAYLTRYIYLPIVISPIILMIFFTRINLIIKIKNYSIFLAFFLLVTLPWFIFLLIEKGSPFWNLNYLNIAYRMYHFGNGWNQFPTEDNYSGYVDVFMKNPIIFITTWGKSILEFPGQLINLIPIIGIFYIPGFFMWISTINITKGVLITSLTPIILVTSLLWFEPRFLIVFLPFTIIFTVKGILLIPKKSTINIYKKNDIPIKFPVQSIAIFTIIVISLYQLRSLNNFLIDQALEYQNASDWLKENGYIGVKILESKPHIAFFSQSKDISFRSYSLQSSSINDLPDILSKANPDLFIYDERYGFVEFPQYKKLLNPNKNPFPDLLLPIYLAESPFRLVIYQYIK